MPQEAQMGPQEAKMGPAEFKTGPFRISNRALGGLIGP